MFKFQPRLVTELAHYTRDKFRADFFSGVTVGIIAVPLAMAFAIASGVSPEQGLITAIVAGFVIAAFGGTRLCVGGPTGAFIVVLYAILAKYGWANLVICTMMAGVILVALGLLKLGALIRFVPNSVILGFTNGIAVLIALSQIKDLLGLSISHMPGEFFGIVKTLWQHLHMTHWPSLAMAAICLAILFVWPKRWARLVPAPFVVVIIATLALSFNTFGIATIGSRFGNIAASFPAPQWPDIELTQLGPLIAPAITIALLAAIESLLCAVVADKQTKDRSDPNQELIGQGLANIVTPLFGGLAATSAMARTSANVKNGAQTPVAAIIHALVVLLFLLVAAPLAKYVPFPALAAILLWVAFHMGEWHAFNDMKRFTPLRNITFVTTFALTVLFNITVAVEVGMLLAAFLLIKRLTEAASIHPIDDLAKDADAPSLPLPPSVAAIRLRGALFFGVSDKLEAQLRVPGYARVIILDMLEVIYMDTNAADVLKAFAVEQLEHQREVIVFGLSRQAESLFMRTGLTAELGR
ncbi:MAG: SulP family inorganic anion transporter, partial [Casimicrobium sp.]